MVALRQQAATRALKAAGIVMSSREETSANNPEHTLVCLRRSSSAEALRTAPDLLTAGNNLENDTVQVSLFNMPFIFIQTPYSVLAIDVIDERCTESTRV